MSESNIGILFKVFLLFLIFAVLGFVLITVFAKLPVSKDSAVNTVLGSIRSWYTTAYVIIDNSFFFLIVFILFLGLYDAYMHPDKRKIILGLIELFSLAYLNLVIVTALPAFSIFNPSALLPITTTFFNSVYKEVIIYFIIIFSIIFNYGGSH